MCPYGFLYGNRHYLVAYSMNSKARDYRLFSLSNIEKVEVTDFPFRRHKEFLLRAFAERSFGVFQEKPFDVVWRFSPNAAADAKTFLFHPTQTLEDQPDGSLIVRFRAGGALEMCWHLFTWGDEVEVLAPPHLQAFASRTHRKDAIPIAVADQDDEETVSQNQGVMRVLAIENFVELRLRIEFA